MILISMDNLIRIIMNTLKSVMIMIPASFWFDNNHDLNIMIMVLFTSTKKCAGLSVGNDHSSGLVT